MRSRNQSSKFRIYTGKIPTAVQTSSRTNHRAAEVPKIITSNSNYNFRRMKLEPNRPTLYHRYTCLFLLIDKVLII